MASPTRGGPVRTRVPGLFVPAERGIRWRFLSIFHIRLAYNAVSDAANPLGLDRPAQMRIWSWATVPGKALPEEEPGGGQ